MRLLRWWCHSWMYQLVVLCTTYFARFEWHRIINHITAWSQFCVGIFFFSFASFACKTTNLHLRQSVQCILINKHLRACAHTTFTAYFAHFLETHYLSQHTVALIPNQECRNVFDSLLDLLIKAWIMVWQWRRCLLD